jgi:Ulp1 family protease
LSDFSNEVVLDFNDLPDKIGDQDQERTTLSHDFSLSELTLADLSRLEPGGWLNDSLINALMRYFFIENYSNMMLSNQFSFIINSFQKDSKFSVWATITFLIASLR